MLIIKKKGNPEATETLLRMIKWLQERQIAVIVEPAVYDELNLPNVTTWDEGVSRHRDYVNPSLILCKCLALLIGSISPSRNDGFCDYLRRRWYASLRLVPFPEIHAARDLLSYGNLRIPNPVFRHGV